MSDAVVETFALAETAATPERPTDVEHRLLSELIKALDQEVTSWVARRGAAGGHRLIFSWTPPTPMQAERKGALLVERDEHGGVIVSDPLGAAYGTGASLTEAWNEWEEGARDHYEELSREEGRLHPRMIRQLRFLRTLFA